MAPIPLKFTHQILVDWKHAVLFGAWWHRSLQHTSFRGSAEFARLAQWNLWT